MQTSKRLAVLLHLLAVLRGQDLQCDAGARTCMIAWCPPAMPRLQMSLPANFQVCTLVQP